MYNPFLNPAKLLASHLIGILPYPNIPPTTKELCSGAGGTEKQRFLPLKASSRKYSGVNYWISQLFRSSLENLKIFCILKCWYELYVLKMSLVNILCLLLHRERRSSWKTIGKGLISLEDMLQVENLDKVYTSSKFEKKQKRLPLAKISVIVFV